MTDTVDAAIDAYIRRFTDNATVASRSLVHRRGERPSGRAREVYRVVLRESGSERSIYAKRQDWGGALLKETEVALALSSAGDAAPAAVPVPLLYAGDVLLSREVAGRPFASALGLVVRGSGGRRDGLSETLEDLTGRAGEWLASFHRDSTLAGLLGRHPEGSALEERPVRRFEDHARFWGGMFLPPGLVAGIRHAVERAAGAGELDVARGPVHGDMCPEQLVMDLERTSIGVLDFENAHIGYQLWDVARFCGRLRLLVVRYWGAQQHRLIDRLECRFLDGYTNGAPLDTRAFRVMRLVELLRIRSPLVAGPGLRARAKAWARRLKYRSLIRREWASLRRSGNGPISRGAENTGPGRDIS